LSLRAKIIIGYSYIEEVFYDSQGVAEVFELKRKEKLKLARHLLQSARGWLQEEGLQNGNEIKKEFFNQNIVNFFSRKEGNREANMINSISDLVGDKERVLEMIPKLKAARNTLAHDVNCNSSELNECLSFLQEVIIAYVERKLEDGVHNYVTPDMG
jgi:hypothetical protein